MAKPDSANIKSRLSHLLENSWFWVIVCLLFILLPIVWQWMESGNPNPLATLRRIFSGDIDWQAWWAFGTFLIALIAALIAYQEYNAHQRAMQPLLIARSEKLDEMNTAIILNNVGGGTATAITVKLLPGVTIKPIAGTHNADEPINLEKKVPMLKPGEATEALDSTRLSSLNWLATPKQPIQTVQLEWEDTSGRHYNSNGLKLNFNEKIIELDGTFKGRDTEQ